MLLYVPNIMRARRIVRVGQFFLIVGEAIFIPFLIALGWIHPCKSYGWIIVGFTVILVVFTVAILVNDRKRIPSYPPDTRVICLELDEGPEYFWWKDGAGWQQIPFELYNQAKRDFPSPPTYQVPALHDYTTDKKMRWYTNLDGTMLIVALQLVITFEDLEATLNYQPAAPDLVQRVGRMLNDRIIQGREKMPLSGNLDLGAFLVFMNDPRFRERLAKLTGYQLEGIEFDVQSTPATRP